jgi:glycosyltransferase involved in cell wall biosynthesis
VGASDDVEAWMQAADIYCQPNRSPDSFGLAFVEAMAAGLPVVTTRLGGAVEVVDDTCGILVPPGSMADVAGALRTLLADHDLRVRLGAAARARAATFCDLHGSLARIAEALRLASNSLALT